MGGFFSYLRELLGGLREQRILLVGLDNAGKTTLLYKLKLGEHIQTVPTVGFNVETVQFNKLDFIIWDVGGQDSVRNLWRHYYTGVNGIVFVIDAADVNRLPEATTELKQMLEEDQLRNARFLIFANKQDDKNALSRDQIAARLNIGSAKQTCHIQDCSALRGYGLEEGFSWLSKELMNDKSKGSRNSFN